MRKTAALVRRIALAVILAAAALALGCQQTEPVVVVVTATPDVEATVEARVQATVAAVPTPTPVPTATAQPTSTPVPIPTNTPVPTPTSTPTPTPTPSPAPTPTVTPTPTRRPTPTPTPTPIPPLESDPDLLLFGPKSGQIEHESEDGFLEKFPAIATSEDVVVEATFHNPYSTRDQEWEHGFLLRNQGGNHTHWVAVESSGKWKYFHRLGESKAQGYQAIWSSDIDTAPGGENAFRVVMIGPKGWVYVNGKYQGSLDLSAITDSGRIEVFVDDDHEGETRFKDVIVWKWGPSLARQMPEIVVAPTPIPEATPDPKPKPR